MRGQPPCGRDGPERLERNGSELTRRIHVNDAARRSKSPQYTHAERQMPRADASHHLGPGERARIVEFTRPGATHSEAAETVGVRNEDGPRSDENDGGLAP